MDSELIRTLTFCQTKNLVNADSQTYHARYLGLSLSFCISPGQKVSKRNLFQMFKDGRYSPPQSALFTGYSSTSAAEHTCISIHQMASEKHGRTLIKLYVFENHLYCNKRDVKLLCYYPVMNIFQPYF